MQRFYLHAKIHQIPVTDKALHYNGSLTIGRNILEEIDLQPGERVLCGNITNGQRWETYIIPSDEDNACVLNGGVARLGEVEDRLVVMAFCLAEEAPEVRTLHLD